MKSIYFILFFKLILSDFINKVPTIDTTSVMFWRPQKVGSSSIISLLVSYSFRYNLQSHPRDSPNYLCSKIAKCSLERDKHNNETKRKLKNYTSRWKSRKNLPIELKNFQMSLAHEICNLPSKIISRNLQCGFQSKTYPREFIVLRNPLSRVLSVYYFWGELWKMRQYGKRANKFDNLQRSSKLTPLRKSNSKKLNDNKLESHFKNDNQDKNDRRILQTTSTHEYRLGEKKIINNKNNGTIEGPLFKYHGDESTVPPYQIAMLYAKKIPYRPGMPGPSYTWSAYAESSEEAINGFNELLSNIIENESDSLFQKLSTNLFGYSNEINQLKSKQVKRILPVITERLDESLIVLSEHLQWSIADMINVMMRKSLSSHPPLSAWPIEAIKLMNQSLITSGEWEYYQAGITTLNQRIQEIKNNERNIKTQSKENLSLVNYLQFDEKVQLLKILRQKVTKYCLSSSSLIIYREFLSSHLAPHPKGNKLRDVPDEYVNDGHCFSLGVYEKELIFSFDVCSGCESHNIMDQLENEWKILKTIPENFDVIKWIMNKLEDIVYLNELSENKDEIKFKYCPNKN